MVLEKGIIGSPVWPVRCAVALRHDTGQVSHRIAPDIDGERDLLMGGIGNAVSQ
jgi:hypothetical protein